MIDLISSSENVWRFGFVNSLSGISLIVSPMRNMEEMLGLVAASVWVEISVALTECDNFDEKILFIILLVS